MNAKPENRTDDIALNDEALEDVVGGRSMPVSPSLGTRTISLNGPNSRGSAKVSPLGITKLDWSYDSTSGGTTK